MKNAKKVKIVVTERSTPEGIDIFMPTKSFMKLPGEWWDRIANLLITRWAKKIEANITCARRLNTLVPGAATQCNIIPYTKQILFSFNK